jgi:hypothetical protein
MTLFWSPLTGPTAHFHLRMVILLKSCSFAFNALQLRNGYPPPASYRCASPHPIPPRLLLFGARYRHFSVALPICVWRCLSHHHSSTINSVYARARACVRVCVCVHVHAVCVHVGGEQGQVGYGTVGLRSLQLATMVAATAGMRGRCKGKKELTDPKCAWGFEQGRERPADVCVHAPCQHVGLAGLPDLLRCAVLI